MVDCKAQGEEMYKLLKKQMEPYKEYFCSVDNGEYKEGAVLFFLSGDRPKNSLPKENSRFTFLDGQIKDLGQGIPASLEMCIRDSMYSAWTANRGKLWLDNSQYTGLSKTYCANRLITDSGAGGTALATGHKTNYHMVGVDPEGKPLESLTTLANKKGLSSGIAVTCRLWDATPADFCCHNTDRDAEAEIVADYVNCGVDYVFGGGSKLFENRADGRDLFKELREKGYQTPRSWEELAKIQKGKVFCVTDTVDTPLPAERGDLLARASMKAIDLLGQNPEGFFLMVEGSQLDDYGHFNDIDLLMQETHDFDRTIGRIFEWAAQDGETLVVVTADHETGGLTLVDGDLNLSLIHIWLAVYRSVLIRFRSVKRVMDNRLGCRGF